MTANHAYSWRLLSAALVLGFAACAGAAELPQFQVPGFEENIQALNGLHARHHEAAFTPCTLWDAWLPMATLWASEKKRAQYRDALLERHIDEAGYVSMQQHRGLAHPGGWPFPTWHQSGGIGWHFTHAHDPYSVQLKVPLASLESLALNGVADARIAPNQGLIFSTQGNETRITSARSFRIDTHIAPFVVVEWSGVPSEAKPRLEWTTDSSPEFDESRSVPVPLENARPGHALLFSAVPVNQHPEWKGHVTGLRLAWENKEANRQVTIRAIHTAVDSRHPITNTLFILGCTDFFRWTGDVDFLRQQIGRLRRVIAYARKEFAFEQHGCVLVPWVGHDGRKGFVHDAAGNKTILYGHGVGNNYWDLLPFGHRDCYASMLLFAALRTASELERAIEAHPEWNLPPRGDSDPSADKLDQMAANLRDRASALFWNEERGRFVACLDADGIAHDYGFTFLNLEAIHYGFASDAQSRRILEWIDGEREIEGDTSTGADIYHWRFAPRATTRRNIEWYSWVWHAPDTIPWGGQVQDGGAVLGYSYHDLMARLKTKGPDDAWNRLREILMWYREVQAEDGYRAYYDKPERGTLQGGGTAGGLGLDHEFLERVLVPQVMLHGFLGFHASPDGYEVHPRLPKDWPSLTITGIRFQNQVLDITAYTDGRVETKSRTAP